MEDKELPNVLSHALNEDAVADSPTWKSGSKTSAAVGYNVEAVSFSLGEVTHSLPKRPCRVYQEISFGTPCRVDFLVFKNYYTAMVTIQSLDPASRKWSTVADQTKLMKSPHYEDDAQDWHVIPLGTLDGLNKNNVYRLRLYYEQPSPLWRAFSVRQVQCFRSVVLPPAGGSSASMTTSLRAHNLDLYEDALSIARELHRAVSIGQLYEHDDQPQGLPSSETESIYSKIVKRKQSKHHPGGGSADALEERGVVGSASPHTSLSLSRLADLPTIHSLVCSNMDGGGHADSSAVRWM